MELTENAPKAITSDHQASGTHGIAPRKKEVKTIEQFFIPGIRCWDSSVLGEMVEDVNYGPTFMDLSSDWFTGIPML
jgi:hypothetical protein